MGPRIVDGEIPGRPSARKTDEPGLTVWFQCGESQNTFRIPGDWLAHEILADLDLDAETVAHGWSEVGGLEPEIMGPERLGAKREEKKRRQPKGCAPIPFSQHFKHPGISHRHRSPSWASPGSGP